MTKSTDVAIKGQATNLERRQQQVGRGSENVTKDDLALPRLKLLQALNPEVTKGSAQYIPEAETGMIMNSLNSKLFNKLFIINLHYDRKTVVWRKRKFGGGMFGTYMDEAEALQALADAKEDAAQYDISDNPTHLVMLLSDSGEPMGVALLDMPGTKAKISRKWNSLIAEQEEAGNPRFGCVWELGVTNETSQNGPYFNYDIDFVVVAPDEIYAAAENAFNSFFGQAASQPQEQDEDAA